jgi:hypothetical protein
MSADKGALMGVCVGQRCIGLAVASADWRGDWRHARRQHVCALPCGASHVSRVELGQRAAGDVARWARAGGVSRAWLEAPEPEPESVSHVELAALLVSELVAMGIDVSSAGPSAAGPSKTPEQARQRFIAQGTPGELCAVEYVALAMLELAHQQRAGRVEQLRAARESMPTAIARILEGLAR